MNAREQNYTVADLNVDEMTSDACIEMISERARRYRIEYPMTQSELSDRSGVSLRCIQLFESGSDIKFSNLIKIIDALGLGQNLTMLIPDVTQRPSAFLDKKAQRQRAYKSRKEQAVCEKKFKWGDEN